MEGQRLLDKINEEWTKIDEIDEINDYDTQKLKLNSEDVGQILNIYKHLMSLDELTEQQAQTISNILEIAEFETSLDSLIARENQLAFAKLESTSEVANHSLGGSDINNFQEAVWKCVREMRSR
jgi:hypothetical protein